MHNTADPMILADTVLHYALVNRRSRTYAARIRCHTTLFAWGHSLMPKPYSSSHQPQRNPACHT